MRNVALKLLEIAGLLAGEVELVDEPHLAAVPQTEFYLLAQHRLRDGFVDRPSEALAHALDAEEHVGLALLRHLLGERLHRVRHGHVRLALRGEHG